MVVDYAIPCTHRNRDVMCQLDLHLHEVVEKTWNFSGRLLTEQDHFLNAAIGLAAEAGEYLDIHKKVWYHTQPSLESEREHLLSELGDVAYYWLKCVDLHGFTIKEVLAYNQRKLASRHPELGEVKERLGPEAIQG